MVDGLVRRQKTEDRGQKFGRSSKLAVTGSLCRGFAAPSSWACRVAAHNSLSSVFWHLSSVVCLLYSVVCPLNAEELADPTRPPDSLFTVAPSSGVSVSGAAAIHPAGLQSIIISKARRAAIIDGRTVELGSKYGDAKLIEVNEGSIVFYGAQGRQVMTLFPDVKMTMARIPTKNEAKTDLKLKTKLQSQKNKAHKANQAMEEK